MCHSLIRFCLVLFCLGSFGCAAINVEVSPTVDWSRISRVAYQPPDGDPWGLSPMIQSELENMDWTVLGATASDADLIVRYYVTQGPDLNADGEMLTRLKSFHVQLIDPKSATNIAVVDYFYPDSLSDPTDESVTSAFNELRQQVLKSRGQQTTLHETSSPAVTPAPADPLPDQAEASAPVSNPKKVISAESAARSTQKSQEAAVSTAETADSSTVPSETEQQEEREIKPRTQSPWIPRFHSWGFENWGEEPIDDY